MKFGRLTNPTLDILNQIKAASDLGLDYVEIGIEGPEGTTEKISKKKSQILASLKKYKMFAIGHTSWWAELGSVYEPVRMGWIEEGKKAIRLCSELNINILNFHSHSSGMFLKVKEGRKAVLNSFVRSLKELVKYGKEYNVEIMLENMPDKGEITDLVDFKYIIDRVPGLKVHLDIGHAYISGNMKGVDAFIRTFKGKLSHIHLHDNHGVSDEHLPLGAGTIDYKRVIELLKKVGYNGTITFEIFSKDIDLFEGSLKKVRKLCR
jgi:sugar phosphate isomerase/epimerase